MPDAARASLHFGAVPAALEWTTRRYEREAGTNPGWQANCFLPMHKEIHRMKDLTLKLFIKAQALKDSLKDESGQDMVEYAIVMGLIALGATAAMKTLATTIGTGFTNVGTKLTTYTS
jgi:pilus assembly protein Flp/PilA